MNYKINEKQLVSITLQEGEKIYADPGKMISKSENVKMSAKMVGGIVNAIERKMTGNAAMLTVFEAVNGAGIISLAGVLPGKVREIALGEGEEFVAEHFAFLAAEDSIQYSIQPIGISAAFFGGAGIILLKLTGPGTVFIQPVGDTLEYDLDGTSRIEVDPGHIAGFDSSLSFKIKPIDNVRSAMFAGEGLFLATFSGKGRILLHSISRYKLSLALYKEGQTESKGSKGGD